MLWNTIMLAFREIRRNLVRSMLTMLGIVIGVAAVITMVTLGNGATASVSTQISSLGSNLILVMPGHRMGMHSGTAPPQFKVSDAEAISMQISGISVVAPVVQSSVTAVAASKNWNTSVTGTTNDYFTAGNWKLANGRTFSDAEERGGKNVCVIGDRVKRELFGAQSPVGTNLRLQNFSCQIIGTLVAKGQGSMGNDQDDTIIAPLRTVQRRMTGSTDVRMLMVSAQADADTDKVKTRIEQLMRQRRNLTEGEENNFNVLDTKEIAQTLSGTTKILTLLLGAVAAVSLLVGGIGIMNIMLVSVTERTREIGVRLAIGALEREVLLQFLIEAVALSAVGGIIGIILATIASVSLAALMNLPFIFDARINLASFAFSAAIGVIFGFMPARRAARLNPIDALRHE
ncbi:MAG: ABC transporter permease [Alphaproteobacteria bacterium]|nr:ABC transporter permease [Alphaproteobacteria bacterium]